MLQNLNERVRFCYERASAAREQADNAPDLERRAHFVRMERRWLLLARSNEFRERQDPSVQAMPTPLHSHPFDPYTMLQASGAAMFAKDKRSRMMVANPACLELVGKDWRYVGGRNDLQWHVDRVQARQLMSNDQLVIESGQTHVYEELFDTRLGSRIFLATKAPLLNEQGEVVGVVGVTKDITERKRREERADLLRGEMAHRLKNIVSLVQAMARQSIDPGDGLSRFQGRLRAYARSQELVARQHALPLHVLIHAHLHSLPAADLLHVDGPSVMLAADAAIQIGIALHELITNSIKHGALGGEGRVDLRWNIETSEGRKFLVLSWQERHGQKQAQTFREGFGYTVLARAVAHNLGGVASFEVLPGQVNWSLRAELTD